MKIISRNVNGIRAVVKKGFFDFIEKYDPDILCLQETKAFECQFLDTIGGISGYKYIWHSGKKPGYAGTAIFYKEDLEIISMKNCFGDTECFYEHGRITEIEFDRFVLLNGYFPNGGTKADGTEMLTYKLDFYDKLIKYIKNIVSSGKNIIITGDFNICHTEIDIARPKENQNSIGFLPIERDKVSELLSSGFVDVRRKLNPDVEDIYSWWSYRAGARARNVGRRIDYFVVNESFLKDILNMRYLNEVLGSDHCPLELILK